MSNPIAKGDTVYLRYTGTLDNGEIFDSNAEEGAQPLVFKAGTGQVIPGFDNAVMGMAKGESKKFRIEAKDAYGERDPKLIQKAPLEAFGETKPYVGMHVDLEDERGNVFHADVVAVDAESVTLDMNPHLAGEALTFDITILDVKKA
ncbi:MAG TPA: peptidylprolyl isomerase [Candidatus Thermoplasmatota archaeon]|nr:peptidylprolyl isomerase [Candidatus Thermoplasmatota archaeon]